MFAGRDQGFLPDTPASPPAPRRPLPLQVTHGVSTHTTGAKGRLLPWTAGPWPDLGTEP